MILCLKSLSPLPEVAQAVMSASFVHCVCAIALLVRVSAGQERLWHACAGVCQRELKPLERTKSKMVTLTLYTKDS